MAQSRTEVHRAPDWEMKAMCPLLGMAGGETHVELAARDDDPQAVGPEDAHAVEAAADVAGSRSSSAWPSAPALAEPGGDDDHAQDAGLAAVAHEVRAPGAAAAQITARSGVRGRLALGKQGMPMTASKSGLTG